MINIFLQVGFIVIILVMIIYLIINIVQNNKKSELFKNNKKIQQQNMKMLKEKISFQKTNHIKKLSNLGITIQNNKIIEIPEIPESELKLDTDLYDTKDLINDVLTYEDGLDSNYSGIIVPNGYVVFRNEVFKRIDNLEKTLEESDEQQTAKNPLEIKIEEQVNKFLNSFKKNFPNLDNKLKDYLKAHTLEENGFSSSSSFNNSPSLPNKNQVTKFFKFINKYWRKMENNNKKIFFLKKIINDDYYKIFKNYYNKIENKYTLKTYKLKTIAGELNNPEPIDSSVWNLYILRDLKKNQLDDEFIKKNQIELKI